jgi:tetratricopeptide (TPR) repeat protein
VPRVNSIIGGALAAALVLALPALARADDWGDCRSNDTAKSVAGCGVLIERGGLSDPQLGEAYSRRAMALRFRNQIDNALADITKALELIPNNTMAYTTRGSIQAARRDYESALKDYSRALELSQTNTTALAFRGNLLVQTGKIDQAISDYDRAIALSPNYAEPYFGRGEAHRMRGELDLALADLNRAVAINPNRTNYLAARGDVFNAKGELDRALADYDRALTIAPNDKFLQERRRVAAVAREQLGGSRPQPSAPSGQAITPAPTLPVTPSAPAGQRTAVSQAAALYNQRKYDEALTLSTPKWVARRIPRTHS